MASPSESQPRADLYGLLAELLSFPTRDLADSISAGEIAHSIHLLAESVPDIDPHRNGLSEAVSAEDLEADYIRVFDLPGGGPACPLYAGVYAPSRKDAMEEILRFYRYFGLTMAEAGKDLPDSVPTLLEFAGFLTRRGESDSALRDLLARHLMPWASATATRLPKRSPGAFYLAVAELAHEFLAGELRRLENELGPADRSQLAPSR